MSLSFLDRALPVMLVTAVFFLFPLKLKWPKNKSICDVAFFIYLSQENLNLIDRAMGYIFTPGWINSCSARVKHSFLIVSFPRVRVRRIYSCGGPAA